MRDRGLTKVGRVAKVFGNAGELSLGLLDTFPDPTKHEEPLFVYIDKLAVPLFLERFERRGRSGATAVFADIDNELRASELVGLDLYAANPAEPDEDEDDELYLEDLVGYTALLGDGRTAEIAGFIDSELNPLFRMDMQGIEIFVPAADDLLVEVDEKRRTATFALPDGLLELYTE